MQRFAETYGIEARDFLNQLAHMAADAGDGLDNVELSAQRPASPRNPDQWESVRRIYSLGIPELHAVMADIEARQTLAEVEICEQSPLIKTPFVNSVAGPVCLHHKS